MTRKARKSTTKESPRFHITIARLFQSMAYVCLFVGLLALVGVITGLIVTNLPQSESSTSGGGSYSTGSNTISWIALAFRLSTGTMVFVEIILGALVLLVIAWGIKSAIRIMRRWTWRLADEIMKPLIIVEPILLLILWALTIIGAWFLIKDESFLALGLISLIFLLVGLTSLLIMRKLAKNYLDYTRADLVFRR
jgi:hypothetical protein